MRVSLSNRFFSVSHAQFVDYCDTFRDAVERSFKTPCRLTLAGYAVPKEYVTFVNPEIERILDGYNASRMVFNDLTVCGVTPELWYQARHVEGILRPVNEPAAAPSAVGHIDFKGHLPRSVTFSLEPGGEDVRRLLLDEFHTRIVGNGRAEHGNANQIIRGASAAQIFNIG